MNVFLSKFNETNFLQGFGLLAIITLLVDIIMNSRKLKTDFYIQGPSVQSDMIKENLTASTIYKD